MALLVAPLRLCFGRRHEGVERFHVQRLGEDLVGEGEARGRSVGEVQGRWVWVRERPGGAVRTLLAPLARKVATSKSCPLPVTPSTGARKPRARMARVLVGPSITGLRRRGGEGGSTIGVLTHRSI